MLSHLGVAHHPVVLGALAFSGQHFISLGNLLELFASALLRVFVWVPLARQLPVVLRWGASSRRQRLLTNERRDRKR